MGKNWRNATASCRITMLLFFSKWIGVSEPTICFISLRLIEMNYHITVGSDSFDPLILAWSDNLWTFFRDCRKKIAKGSARNWLIPGSLLSLKALENRETSACMCWILLVGSSSSQETTEVTSAPWKAGKLELKKLGQSPDKQVLTRSEKALLWRLCPSPKAVMLLKYFLLPVHFCRISELLREFSFIESLIADLKVRLIFSHFFKIRFSYYFYN